MIERRTGVILLIRSLNARPPGPSLSMRIILSFHLTHMSEGYAVKVRVLVKGQRTCSDKGKKIRQKKRQSPNFPNFDVLWFLLGL